MNIFASSNIFFNLHAGLIAVVEGNFVTQPVSVTVFPGVSAMFSCAASRLGLGGVYWLVTEERLLPHQLEDFYQATTWYIDENNPDTSTGVLQMTGTALIHNTSVQCLASYPYGDSIFSDKVYLQVQGMYSI